MDSIVCHNSNHPVEHLHWVVCIVHAHDVLDRFTLLNAYSTAYIYNDMVYQNIGL